MVRTLTRLRSAPSHGSRLADARSIIIPALSSHRGRIVIPRNTPRIPWLWPTGHHTSVSQRPLSSSASPRAGIPQVPLWIAGEPVLSSTGGIVTIKHSKHKRETCELVVAGEAETKRAAEASWTAFEQWRETSGWERRKILGRVLTLLQDRFDDFAYALRDDVAMSDILIGADRASAMNIVDRSSVRVKRLYAYHLYSRLEGLASSKAAAHMRDLADSSRAITADGWIPPTLDGNLALVLRQPYGPVLSIPAFNYPLTLALRSVVYPLACGNTVIMKSSIIIPQLHKLFAQLFHDAGLPKGVLQILNFSEEHVVEGVNQLIADPNIRMINFTGSTRVGREIAVTCAEHLKPSVLELGGKAAAIILPSADLKLSANNVLFGALVNSGQICMSTERVFAHEEIADAFEAALVDAAHSLEDREGFELVRPDAVDEVQGLIRDAIDSGARLLYPSKFTSSPSGTSLTPHILASLPAAARLTRTEAFAPVLTLHRFSDANTGLRELHATPLGLSTSLFGSLDEALPLARRIESGAVHINGMTVHDQHGLPFGGVKESGWGRFNGRGAVESFMWTKNVVINEGHELPLRAM